MIFKRYKVNSLFNIHPTKSYGLTNEELYNEIGDTPVVCNSSENNGIGGYVKRDPTELGGIITFSDTTNGATTIFYQPQAFIGYSHVQGMYPICPVLWNEKSLMYFVVALKKSVGIWFDWATKFTREICGNLLVELPAKDNGDIDFMYMENYIDDITKNIIAKKNDFLAKRDLIGSLSDDDKTILKSKPLTKEFLLGDLFTVKGNPQLNKESFKSSKDSIYPYFTRTVFNNGIESYVDYLDEEHKVNGNSISVGMLGMQFFYQPSDFYAGQFTKTLFPKFDVFNEKIALFFVTILNKHTNIFKSVLVRDFEKVFNRTKVCLPVDKEQKIDFSYIEKYISALEKKVVIDNLN